MKSSGQPGKPFCLFLGLLLSTIAAWLGYVILGLESASTGLVEMVMTNLGASGVSNPVTAVLINFRGYDTLLEMGVLLLALLGVWSLGDAPQQPEVVAGAILTHVPRILVPILILVAGYLLWVGAHAPGGAFQSGSVLGAAGVLLLLTGWRIEDKFIGFPLRITLILGLAFIVLVATLPLLSGNAFFQYPLSLAGSMILLIESAATLSIGVTLTLLFLGGLPGAQHR